MTTSIDYNPTRLYEINYSKLIMIAPGLDVLPLSSAVLSSNGCKLALSVFEQSRYTSTMLLVFSNPRNIDAWIPFLEFTVRAYHDAEVAEVLSFEKHTRIKPRYEYPNEKMYQPDEKRQINRFLADTLGFCLRAGLRFSESWEPVPTR